MVAACRFSKRLPVVDEYERSLLRAGLPTVVRFGLDDLLSRTRRSLQAKAEKPAGAQPGNDQIMEALGEASMPTETDREAVVHKTDSPRLSNVDQPPVSDGQRVLERATSPVELSLARKLFGGGGADKRELAEESGAQPRGKQKVKREKSGASGEVAVSKRVLPAADGLRSQRKTRTNHDYAKLAGRKK